MKYPVQRFIHCDLGITFEEFCQKTRWDESILEKWQNEHVQVTELPIAILTDLAKHSRFSLSVGETFEKLNNYQKLYYNYVKSLRNHFGRIPNAAFFAKELKRLHISKNAETTLQEVTDDLDNMVYCDLFTVNEAMNERRLSHKLAIVDEEQSDKAAEFEFLVKIIPTPNGKPLAFYEYTGCNRVV